MIIGRVLLVANKDGRSTFVALTVIVSKALYWHLFPTTPFEKNYFTMNFSEENLSMLVEAQVTSTSTGPSWNYGPRKRGSHIIDH